MKISKAGAQPESEIEQNKDKRKRGRNDDRQSLTCALKLLELPTPFQLIFAWDLYLSL